MSDSGEGEGALMSGEDTGLGNVFDKSSSFFFRFSTRLLKFLYAYNNKLMFQITGLNNYYSSIYKNS